MGPLLSIFALLAAEPPVPANDPPKPTSQAVQADLPMEDHEGTLRSLRQRRERLAATLGPNHPQMVSIDQAIAFREAYIPLKAKLDQRKAEVRDLEAELKRLLDRYAAETSRSPQSAVSTVEQKLDAILRRLDQMDKRLSDLEKAKQP